MHNRSARETGFQSIARWGGDKAEGENLDPRKGGKTFGSDRDLKWSRRDEWGRQLQSWLSTKRLTPSTK
jgi:hypothetical protein